MATPSKVDLKPVCKYGAKCYRKNEQHIKQYRHSQRDNEDADDEPPKKKKREENTPKAKAGTIEQYFGKKNAKDPEENKDDTAGTSKSATEKKYVEKPPEDKEQASDVDDDDSEEEEEAEVPASPVDVRENIKQKFLVEMPEDFYDFWKLCKKLNEEDPLASRAVDRVTDGEWYSDHHQASPLYTMLKELVARVSPVPGIIWTQTDLWEQEGEELQSVFILCVELCRQLQDRTELRPLADVIEELQSCD
ncbi:hypothetical protein ACOMHN_018066 [Nucella lapillus]